MCIQCKFSNLRLLRFQILIQTTFYSKKKKIKPVELKRKYLLNLRVTFEIMNFFVRKCIVSMFSAEFGKNQFFNDSKSLCKDRFVIP